MQEIYRRLWPEVLRAPINPPETPRKWAEKLVGAVGLGPTVARAVAARRRMAV